MKKIYKIDATNKKLGRLAAKAAPLLRGKNQADFAPNKKPEVKVIIFNTSKLIVTGKKFDNKLYYNYSGYPGGIKARNFKEIFEKDPNEPLKIAIYGMLPDNKLRKKMMKNLKLYAQEIK